MKNILIKIILFVGLLFSFTASHPPIVEAVDISDYTAYPPFLPRVVSPNILFLLDYSSSMIRPAYGQCKNIADSSDAGESDSDSGDANISDCRYSFSHVVDDYNSATTYPGNFDSNADYNCSGSGSAMCEKETGTDPGEWQGNWLNWLTSTQFDILKKVVIGGDIDPAPEQGNPTKLRSRLGNSPGVTIKKTMNLPGSGHSTSCSSTYSPDCIQWPTVSYNWIATPGSGVTTVFGTANINDAVSSAQDLPFPFTFYGNTYTKIYISTNGVIGFTNDTSLATALNADMPSASGPNNIIAPYWDERLQVLITGVSLVSSIKTFTQGTAPSRIHVITFQNIHHEDDTGKAEPLTFQVLLYEGSNHIVFQYGAIYETKSHGGGKVATVGVENSDGTKAKKYSYNGSTLLVSNTAIFATPHISYTITPGNETSFQPAAPLVTSSNLYKVYIDINGVAKVSGSCPSGSYYNKDRDSCYDHETVGLLQDFRDGELGGTLGFRLAIMQLNSSDGGTIVKHFNQKDTSGWSSLMTATRSQLPTTNTPLAEALYEVEGYFKQDTGFRFANGDWTNHGTTSTCSSTGNNYDPYCFQSAAQRVPCTKSFVLIVSSGYYSHDDTTNIYGDAPNTESWSNTWSNGYSLTTGETGPGDAGAKANGGWLDDVANKAHTTDWRENCTSPGTPAGCLDGKQNLTIYAVNTFGSGSLVETDGANILKRATKYGGFEDSNSNDLPDIDSEWLRDSNGDGSLNSSTDLPRTYFEATGGSNLKNKIIEAVTTILKNTASGTSVSVLSTSASGEGAIYQAYFYPSRVEGSTEDRKWPGYLRAFYLDQYQNMRDDCSNTNDSSCSPDAALVMAKDRIVQMYLDTSTNDVKVNLFRDSDGKEPFTAITDPNISPTKMDNIFSIWEGGKKLALRDKSNTAPRNIYTWLLPGTGGTTAGGFSSIGGTPKDFVSSEAANLKAYLRASDPDGSGSLTADDEAGNIIDFIRGKAIPTYNYRNRCVTIDETGVTAETGCTSSKQRVWPLGDIIYSTPTLVTAPGEKYDELYNDSKYGEFKNKYKSRRGMVFVGANDGMLHAFNAGIYTSGDKSGGSDVENGWFEANPDDLDSNANDGWNAAIGDELWAFVPYDNLPHLSWLACNGTEVDSTEPITPTDPGVCAANEYTHVYYVDLRPKVTDVRIFNDTATSVSGLIDGQSGASHPNGWGTILIMGMRLGGGAMDVDVNGDSSITADEQFRSAYYAFDITDTERKPKLLWRFSDSALGFTTSYPAIVKICSNNTTPCSGTEKWFMVVGSGPANNTGTNARDYSDSGTSQTGKLFVVDITDGSLDATFTLQTGNTSMGDLTVVDTNLDFTSDVIYIGSGNSTSSTTTTGKVFRITTGGNITPTSWAATTLIDTARPLLVGPSVSKDGLGNLWVFFGTGRLRSMGDLSNAELQTFYGIKDECLKNSSTCTTPYVKTDLLNSSKLVVCTAAAGGGIYTDGGAGNCTNTTYGSLNDLITNSTTGIASKHGWYIDLYYSTSNPAPPSERVLSRSVVLGGLVLFTTYQPAADMCSTFGDSKLYAVYYETGTAYKNPVIGTTGDIVNRSMSLGKGMPTAVGVSLRRDGRATGFVQKSTGEIVRVEWQPALNPASTKGSWKEKSGSGRTVEIEGTYKHVIK